MANRPKAANHCSSKSCAAAAASRRRDPQRAARPLCGQPRPLPPALSPDSTAGPSIRSATARPSTPCSNGFAVASQPLCAQKWTLASDTEVSADCSESRSLGSGRAGRFHAPRGGLTFQAPKNSFPTCGVWWTERSSGVCSWFRAGDAHAANDSEFQIFPPHCVQGTPGANIVSEGLAEKYLTIPNDAAFRLPPDLRRTTQLVLEKQTLDVFDTHASTLVERLGSEPEYLVPRRAATKFCVRCAAKGLIARARSRSFEMRLNH